MVLEVLPSEKFLLLTISSIPILFLPSRFLSFTCLTLSNFGLCFVFRHTCSLNYLGRRFVCLLLLLAH